MHAPENEKGLHTWYISYVDTEHYDLVLLCYHHCLIQTIISVWIVQCMVHLGLNYSLMFHAWTVTMYWHYVFSATLYFMIALLLILCTVAGT